MFDICDCDVKDKEKLALFRLKRSEWKRHLIEDTFSISKQISEMLWNDTVFRTINEARKLTAKRNTGFNEPLLELFDQGYITTQVMAIRRLTDSTFHDSNKAVISLPSLIDDILKNCDLISRENYICYEGIAFEADSHEENVIRQLHLKKMHSNFDKLSNVSTDEHKRTDKIVENVFRTLKKELKVCEGLRIYANKFVAHASDARNQTNLTEKQKEITLQKLDDSYKAILRVASFLNVLVLSENSFGSVPVPQFNPIENLDKPMVAQEDLSNLYSYWQERTREVDSWAGDFGSIFKGITNKDRS